MCVYDGCGSPRGALRVLVWCVARWDDSMRMVAASADAGTLDAHHTSRTHTHIKPNTEKRKRDIRKYQEANDRASQAPEVQTMYSLNLPVSVLRTKVRQEYERHRYVNQLKTVDVLLFNSHQEFQVRLVPFSFCQSTRIGTRGNERGKECKTNCGKNRKR